MSNKKTKRQKISERGSSECPVCLDTVTDITFPYNCVHQICSKCDNELFCRGDDRCPLCRQERRQDSARIHSTNLNNSRRREASLAVQNEGSVHQTVLFFPREEVLDANAAGLLIYDSNQSQINTRFGDDVSNAINALIDVVPLPEFLAAVQQLRELNRVGGGMRRRRL